MSGVRDSTADLCLLKVAGVSRSHVASNQLSLKRARQVQLVSMSRLTSNDIGPRRGAAEGWLTQPRQDHP